MQVTGAEGKTGRERGGGGETQKLFAKLGGNRQKEYYLVRRCNKEKDPAGNGGKRIF